MKTCSKCSAKKPATEFYKNKSNSDGFHCQCKSCMNADHNRRDHKKRLPNKKCFWPTDSASFGERLEFYSIPEPNTGCILWTGATTNYGYGVLTIKAKRYAAHRLAFENAHGNIPQNISVCHKCDTPACINPDHMFLGTHAENMRDMVKKGRHVGSKGKRWKYVNGVTIHE